MKINDFITSPNTLIFGDIFKQVFPEDYTEIFGDTDAAYLDLLFGQRYGNKVLICTISNADIFKNTVCAVIALYKDGWKRQADALRLSYNVLTPVTLTTTHTEEITSKSTNDNTTVNANVPYNETTFTDNDKATVTGAADHTETRTTTDTQSGYGTNGTMSAAINREINLAKLNFRLTIMQDIINEITLNIY